MALAAGLVACAVHAAPEPRRFESGRPAHRIYLEQDGIPHSTVHALLLASDGRLWVGTQDGAAVYDGREWTAVDLPTRSLSNFVRAIAETSDGALWFGTQSAGLLRLHEGSWAIFGPGREVALGERINALLAVEREGRPELWVATHDDGLARLRDGQITRFGLAEGLPSPRAWDLLRRDGAAGGEIWAATGEGPVRLSAEGDRFELPDGAPKVSASALLEVRGADGVELWMGTYGEGIARWRAGGWSWIGREEGLANLFVTDLAPGTEPGQVWIATDGGGLNGWNEGRVDPLELGSDLASGAVYRVLETRADQGAAALWLGTRSHGLIRVVEGYWRAFVPVEATPRLPVTALLVEQDERHGETLWLGTDGRGLSRWQAGRWAHFDRASGALANDSVLALASWQGREGRRELWVGTRNGGLSRWDGRGWRHYSAQRGELPNDLVQALLVRTDAAGRAALWIGTRDGLASFDGVAFRREDRGDEDPRGSIVALAESRREGRSNEVWVGTTQGLYRGDGARWRQYGPDQGLRNPTVHALHPSTAATGRPVLWLGTDGGGAYRLDLTDPDARPVHLDELSDGRLPNDVVYAFAEDARGRLYLATNRGVARLVPAGERYAIETYDVHQGLPSAQGNRGAVATDAVGRIWFGTVGGGAALDPAREAVDRVPKRLSLTATSLGATPALLSDGGRLSPDRRRVRFRYRLLSFFGEEHTRYRTRLDGLEPTFGDWSSDPEREFSALAPGEYRFEVWGRDASGNLAGPMTLAFEVEPALWQRGWVRGLLAALLAALVVAAWRARAAAHARRETELEELVAARTRQLESANRLLVELSYLDPVTTIPNRRRFDHVLDEEWRRAARARGPLALVMVDVDGFKTYNDTYGHQLGDECLRRVARTLADHLPRAGDAVARYGGDEFAVLLPATEGPAALALAERLRREVFRLGIPHRGSTVAPQVTATCGVAVRRPLGADSPNELVAAADAALYEAKRAGRNRAHLESVAAALPPNG